MTYQSTKLHAAVIARREKEVLDAISANRSWLDMPDSLGSYPIIDAIKLGYSSIASHLLNAGCNPAVFDSAGESPLSAAWHNKDKEIIHKIIDCIKKTDLDINLSIDDPNKSLIYSKPDTECSRILISHGLTDPYAD